MGTSWIAMLGNISQSLFSVQRLISALAYILGIIFIVIGLKKLKTYGSGGQNKSMTPVSYFLGAAALLFLPSMMNILSNTAFGIGNVLQYGSYNPYNIYSSMGMLIQTGGLIWFVRGCVLLIHSSEEGAKHGKKGLAFLCAGVLAMHFENTVGILNGIMQGLTSITLSIKSSAGY